MQRVITTRKNAIYLRRVKRRKIEKLVIDWRFKELKELVGYCYLR